MTGPSAPFSNVNVVDPAPPMPVEKRITHGWGHWGSSLPSHF
jgi:hypothetical protein